MMDYYERQERIERWILWAIAIAFGVLFLCKYAMAADCTVSLSWDGKDSAGNMEQSLPVTFEVQAYDADLTTYAGITPSTDIQGLLGSANYSTARTNLGLAIGTNVQAYDADLASIRQMQRVTSQGRRKRYRQSSRVRTHWGHWLHRSQ